MTELRLEEVRQTARGMGSRGREAGKARAESRQGALPDPDRRPTALPLSSTEAPAGPSGSPRTSE